MTSVFAIDFLCFCIFFFCLLRRRYTPRQRLLPCWDLCGVDGERNGCHASWTRPFSSTSHSCAPVLSFSRGFPPVFLPPKISIPIRLAIPPSSSATATATAAACTAPAAGLDELVGVVLSGWQGQRAVPVPVPVPLPGRLLVRIYTGTDHRDSEGQEKAERAAGTGLAL